MKAARIVAPKLVTHTLEEHLATLRHLLPDLRLDLDKMKTKDWALLLSDMDAVASKLVCCQYQMLLSDCSHG
jgi:hypothetical protein